MSTPAQQLFRLIVLHNKLMPEADLDKMLREYPTPEECVRAMVQAKVVAAPVGEQLLGLHRKKLADQAHAAAAQAPAPAAPIAGTANPAPATPPAASTPAPAPRAVPAIHVNTSAIDVRTPGKALIHQLLTAARDAGASDLHIKSGEIPIIRRAAILQQIDVPAIPPEICEQSLLDILNPTQREIFDKTKDLDFAYDGGPELGRFRANMLSQHRGVDGVFRIISDRVRSFEELKLPNQIRRFCDYRQGIVLITGPKGAGKTTTLAALVDLINAARAEHIITIEDPIEFVHPCKKGHVNQREVGPHTKSFSNALRAALREAPDVIMVGEMRDLETTSLAITAAETGHLVFATLHTPDAVRTIGRVLDVFPPQEQGQIRAMFSESLRGIVSQLLIPSIDGHSMELAVEIMFNTPAIANTIRESRTHQLRGTMQTGKKMGMMLMDDSLINLVKEKRIAKAEALSRADNVPFVEKELAGVH